MRAAKTFLVGSAAGASAWCDENAVSWRAVAVGRHHSIRFLGIDADRMCGYRPTAEDRIVLVHGSEHMDEAAWWELAMLRKRQELSRAP